MSDVIELSAQRVPDVWQCQCGSHTFWLYADGTAVCSKCEQVALEMTGYWRIPDRADSNANRLNAEIIPLRPR
jgi:hypothetical protein